MIVEGFIDFDYEITLLTVRAVGASGEVETFFCEPIGHVQVNGDYVESWPARIRISVGHSLTRKLRPSRRPGPSANFR